MMSTTVREPDDATPSDAIRSNERSFGRSSDDHTSTCAPHTVRHAYGEPSAFRTEPPWKLPGQPGAFADDVDPDDFIKWPEHISPEPDGVAYSRGYVPSVRRSGTKRWLMGGALMAVGIGGCIWSLDGYERALQVAAPEWLSTIGEAKRAIPSREPLAPYETALAHTAVPRLTVDTARVWRTDEPAPLSIGYADAGPDVSVVINGLAPGSTLWAGTPASANSWRLASTDIKRAVVTPPRGFAGVMNLIFELRLADDTVVDSKKLQLKWSDPISPAQAVAAVSVPAAPAPAAPVPAVSVPALSAASAERHLPAADVALLMKRGAELFANGNIGAARLMFQDAAEAGEPKAAFALAETYDPFVLEDLGAKGITPDVALAQRWYETAKILGSTAAPDRLARLKR